MAFAQTHPGSQNCQNWPLALAVSASDCAVTGSCAAPPLGRLRGRRTSEFDPQTVLWPSHHPLPL